VQCPTGLLVQLLRVAGLLLEGIVDDAVVEGGLVHGVDGLFETAEIVCQLADAMEHVLLDRL